jgi:hypothetical protein
VRVATDTARVHQADSRGWVGEVGRVEGLGGVKDVSTADDERGRMPRISRRVE